MSDDEYYYDDEFDEFQDMLYDADPAPDLADDLAEHSMYSPLWQDDPAEGTREFFSDWEYYSDDYFDDDPVLLKTRLNGGKTQESQPRQPQQTAKRGRKRKLSDANGMPESKRQELAALQSTLKGTVWKARSPELAEVFKSGVEQPVALRLSHGIMQSAYGNKRGFGKGYRSKDESWANDLSLADMGLKTERSLSMHERPAAESNEDEYGGDQHDEYEDAIDQDNMDTEALVDQDAIETVVMSETPSRFKLQLEPAATEAEIIQAMIDGAHSRKRRRASEGQIRRNGGALPTPDASLESELSETAMDAGEKHTTQPSVKRSRGYPSKAQPEQRTIDMKEDSATKGRKRKLSISESSAAGSTVSTRAKRQAIATSTTENKLVVKTATATRPTRSKKK